VKRRCQNHSQITTTIYRNDLASPLSRPFIMRSRVSQRTGLDPVDIVTIIVSERRLYCGVGARLHLDAEVSPAEVLPQQAGRRANPSV
jgi:hypothetical protein